MVDQPGAGGSRSYKIRGYTRERQSAKPYARPPGRRKGVIETVKDFFSPAWLVDLFKGNQRSQPVEIDFDQQDEHNEVSQTVDESYTSNSNLRSSRKRAEVSTATTVGNGQLGSLGPGYFSSILRERGLSSETPSTSRPSRTFGLSSGNDRYGEASTSSVRSEESESEVPSSRRASESVRPETVEEQEDDLSITHEVRQVASSSESIITSTPALFLNPGSKRRANTSIFGEPLLTVEASSSGSANQARPQLFPPSSEYRPGPQPFSLPKNRPSFSVSAFGSTIKPKPPQPGEFSSPFYRGRTSFGGASSLHSAGYKRMRTNSPTLGEAAQPVRKVITPKPVSTGSSGVTSQTAKRILEALENMSSPLIDARKIPTPPVSPSASPLSFSPARRKRPPIPSRAVGSPRSLKAHFPGPPVQDLSAPQRASISKLTAKETASPESTAVSSAALFSTATTTIPTFSKPSVPSFTSTPLPISLSPSSSNSKVGGKVKSARSTSHYTQRDRGDDRADSEVVNPIPEVTTAVPLPLPNGKSLPSFSFSPTSQTGKANSPSTETLVPTANATSTGDFAKNNFKFSAPSTKVPAFSQELSTINQSSSNMITFAFSQPTPVNEIVEVNDNQPMKDAQSTSVVSEFKQAEKPLEPNNNLFNKFAPLPGSWECDTCLVSNKATDTKCVACQSSKPSTGKPAPPKKPAPTNNDLMQKFAPAAGSWSCDSCMLNNDASRTKCIACETPKPGVKPAFTPSKSVNADTNLMKKSAPPADSFSCDTCMLTNKSTSSTGVACQSPKPGTSRTAKATAAPSSGVSTITLPDSSLAAKFAPPSGSWECDTCMVNNKGEDTTCAACQTPKPGAKPTATITSGGFSLPGGKASSSSSSPFQFGVNNSSDANSGAGSSIKFGVDTKPTSGPSFSTPFTFGADNKSTTDSTASVTFTFGSTSGEKNKKSNTDQEAESAGKLPATFRFGATSTNSSEPGENKTTAAPTFTFGSSTFNHDSKDGTAKAPTFTFGASSSSDKDKATSGSVKFGESSALDKQDKPNSIAAAAASGFLKVPGMNEPAKTAAEQTSSSQSGVGLSIADAAKSGFLRVPAVGEKKDEFSSPPVVNIFAPAQNSSGSTTAKPETGSGFTFSMPSAAAAGVNFGSASSTSGSFAQGGLEAAASSGPAFQFGASLSSNPTVASKADTKAVPAPSPFSFPVNTLAPATTTAAAPFTLMANASSTSTAPAPFSFSANTATTASITTSATPAGAFQFAPSGQAPSFQFAAVNNTSVTTAAQPAQQTFSITPTPASSSSETVKPFSFNSGSTSQGFSFAPSNPQATFNFGGSKQSAFAGFGTAQSSSNQQAAKNEPAFALFGAAQSSSNQEVAKQTPTFPGFGGQPQQPSASTFTFTPLSNSTSTPSEETMEADGSNSGANLFAPSANAMTTPFGSSGPSTGFNFAAPTPPASGGFNFSSQATNTGSSPFAFAPAGGGTPSFVASNTPAANATPPAGFNFAPTVTNNNLNSSGMFSFGGVQPQGNTMFTAGTGGENAGIAGRKFKKAVRRTKR